MGHWQTLGRIYDPAEHVRPWARTHACVPSALLLPGGERIRVYHAPRNERGQSLPTYFDVDAADPTRLLAVAEEAVLPLGERGAFDDGGIMPCCALWRGDEVYLYYVGWNPSVSVPYRNACGLAVSRDGGLTFGRAYPGPVVGRNRDEPFFTASPWVLREAPDRWRMYYASGTGFVDSAHGTEPLYVIKGATSVDGRAWERPNRTLIAPAHDREANARATVVPALRGDGYDMWYTYRGSDDYRDGADAYRIGYATSPDGDTWSRADERAGITFADEGWDSTMQTYPCVLDTPRGRYLFYNGNGFGRTGIGVARWTDEPQSPRP